MTETQTPDGSIWRYTCDAFGRRIRKECVKPGDRTPRQATQYLWQGATLAEEHTTNGTATTLSRWHFEPGTFNPVAKETICAAGERAFYPIITDHLGTPKELCDLEGNILWQAEHELWGKAAITTKTGPNCLPIVDCSLRFQNQWEDEESGLYYNLHRYYDPDSGQYLSPDPIGLEGGLRTHGYVHDPMQWVDPLGLAGCPKGGAPKEVETRALTAPYPPNNGVLGSETRKFLMPGDQIDRIGKTGGKYFSPRGTPLDMRALPPNADLSQYRAYEVLKPYEVGSSRIAPYYGKTGLGEQYSSPVSADVLEARGIIRRLP